MAFKYKPNCKVCNEILHESEDMHKPNKSQLYKLINEAQLGKRPMTDVARAYPNLLYISLNNHAKKHQAVTETRLAKAKAKAVETKVQREIKRKDAHHTERRSNIIAWLEEQIEEGNVKPTLSGLTALLKQEADIEEKQKDRTHEMQKLFAGYLANPLPEVAVKHIEYIEGETVEDDTPSSTE